MQHVWYTDEDGKPADFGLGDRWIQEPINDNGYKLDKRQKLKLIGDIISDAAEKGISHSVIAQELHKSLVSGKLIASGRFRATTWESDGEPIELAARVYIAPEEFAPLYNSDNYHICTVGYEDDHKPYFNEWCQFEWMDSSINYAAWGFDTDDYVTHQRWTCRWSSIMVHPDQANKVLATAFPALRTYVRTGYNRVAKTPREIVAKAEEMRTRGITKITDIAKAIRQEEGFEFAQNIEVRELLSKAWVRNESLDQD